MIRLLVTLVVSLVACTPGQTQSTRDEIHLRATVQNVVPLTDSSGKITPVDFDPRFALTVRIESVDPAVGSFTVGAVVAFAIHSPALLFGGTWLEPLTPSDFEVVFILSAQSRGCPLNANAAIVNRPEVVLAKNAKMLEGAGRRTARCVTAPGNADTAMARVLS